MVARVVAGQVHDASLDDEAAQFDEMPRVLAALDLPRAHLMSRPCGLMAVARRPVAQQRRPCCGQFLVHFAATGFEKTRPRAWPMPPSCRPLLSRPERSARRPSSLALSASAPVAMTSSPSCCTLRLLRSRALSPSAFSSASKSRGSRIVVSVSVDGEMIVEHPAQSSKVVRTSWDAVVPPENFSREGALIRRADARFAV